LSSLAERVYTPTFIDKLLGPAGLGTSNWVPDVVKTTLLVAGTNELTGRRCRVYVRPGRKVTVVEDLN
jgi:hypothetical protein